MSFKSSKLLVFGLGVAAAAALSYKFTRFLFGEQRHISGTVSQKRKESGFCLEESRISVASQPLNDEGDYLVEDSKRPVLLTSPSNTSECKTFDKTKTNDARDVGIQCGATSSEVVSTEIQCDLHMEDEKRIAIMHLKLAHTNIFMLKKHFDEELSRQISGDLKGAFYRTQRLGNYIFLQGSTADMGIGATFCAERYDGEAVSRSSLPNGLYIENSVSCMTVVGKASTQS